MSTVNVTHVKGCVEDLEIGEGTVVQQRNGQPVTLTKLGAASIPWSQDPVTGALVSIRTRMEGLESNLVTAVSTATTQAGIATGAANTATTQAGIATGAANTATTQAGIATVAANTATTQAGIATGAAGTATTQAGIATGAANTATTQAGIATGAANTATTQATSADASATLASDWAQKTTGEVVIDQGYSAKYWAQEAASIVTAGVIDDASTSTIKTWSSSKISTDLATKAEVDTALSAKQNTLVSGTNVKTINGESVLGSGNITTPTTTVNNTLTSTSTTEALSAAQGKVLQDNKQATLVSGTNIKTINSTSVLGSGNIEISSGVDVSNITVLEGAITYLTDSVNRHVVITSATLSGGLTAKVGMPLGSTLTKGVIYQVTNRTTIPVSFYVNGSNFPFLIIQPNDTFSVFCYDKTNNKWAGSKEIMYTDYSTISSGATGNMPVFFEKISNTSMLMIIGTNVDIKARVLTLDLFAGTYSLGAITVVVDTALNYATKPVCKINSTQFLLIAQNDSTQAVVYRVITVSGTTVSSTQIANDPTGGYVSYTSNAYGFYVSDNVIDVFSSLPNNAVYVTTLTWNGSSFSSTYKGSVSGGYNAPSGRFVWKIPNQTNRYWVRSYDSASNEYITHVTVGASSTTQISSGSLGTSTSGVIKRPVVLSDNYIAFAYISSSPANFLQVQTFKKGISNVILFHSNADIESTTQINPLAISEDFSTIVLQISPTVKYIFTLNENNSVVPYYYRRVIDYNSFSGQVGLYKLDTFPILEKNVTLYSTDTFTLPNLSKFIVPEVFPQ